MYCHAKKLIIEGTLVTARLSFRRALSSKKSNSILTSVRREHHFGLTLTSVSVYNSHLKSIRWALHSLPGRKVTNSNCEASVVDTEPPVEQSRAPWMLWACSWREGDCEASAWLGANRTELGWSFSHGEGQKCRHSVKNCTLEVPDLEWIPLLLREVRHS